LALFLFASEPPHWVNAHTPTTIATRISKAINQPAPPPERPPSSMMVVWV
jgi:hypothetical protein